MNQHRIELLDSFRFIAVLLVLFYHFTELWIPLYPFGNFYHHLFRYGYLGVQFFFIISGFVISYTLENTPGLLTFYRNRFARLFPPMLLCSVLTFTIMMLMDTKNIFPNAHETKNILPGLVFINPKLLTTLTHVKFNWINGSYWTLWTEVQFYLIASCLYFLNKKHFFRNILLAGIVITIIKYIPVYFLNSHAQDIKARGLFVFFNNWKYIDELFNITFYIVWFIPGVIFYQLYKGFNFRRDLTPLICSVIMLLLLIIDTRLLFSATFVVTMIAAGIMFTLFLLMIYRENYLSFLKASLLIRIGVISYSIYLIHGDIGVLLINKYGGYLGAWSWLSPFIVIIIVTCFAELSYRYYERSVSKFLKYR